MKKIEGNKREKAALGCGDPGGGYTEETLVEQPATALLGELGWKTVNAYHELDRGASRLRRKVTSRPIRPPSRPRPQQAGT